MNSLVIARGTCSLVQSPRLVCPLSTTVLLLPTVYRNFSTETAPSSSASDVSSSSISSSSTASAAYVYYGPSSYAAKPLRSPPRRYEAMKLRVAKIQEGLANQSKVIKDYQKQKPVRPLKQGLLQYIKKNAWEKD